MTEGSIIFRDWLWYVYPVLILFIGVCVFFGFWLTKAVRATKWLRSFRIAASAASVGSGAVTFTVFVAVIFRLLMFVASVFVLWLVFDDTLSGFIRMEFSGSSVRLSYHCGLLDREIPASAIRSMSLRPHGKTAKHFEIATVDGHHYKSVSTDWPNIWEDCEKLSESFRSRGPINPVEPTRALAGARGSP
jgi:hypothetical protein